MASAKNKKKAVATKKVIYKTAPKKAVKSSAKPVKKVAVKKVVKKTASVKSAASNKKTAAKKASVSSKKVALTSKKKVTSAPAKPKGKEKTTTKSLVKKGITKPIASNVHVKSSVAKSNGMAVAPKGVKKPAVAKAITSPSSSNTNIQSASNKSDKKTTVSASKSATPLPTKSKKEIVDKKVPLKSGKPSETIDPLHAKAAKVMKELEETMDLSKMRPRIQAGTAPKPLPKANLPLPKLPEPTNTIKEKYTLEFEFRSSPKILFTSLSDSSGLAGWFADEVHVKDKLFTFAWEGGHSNARLIAVRDLQLVRFEWEEDTDGTYFQFEIKEDDITLDIALVITDFANPGEKDTNIRLWESQVQKLRMLLGSL